MKRLPSILFQLMSLLLVGCSSEGNLPLVPVTGRVTFAGRPCPKGGTITFSPSSVSDGLPRRPGTASFKEDGIYAASSFDQGDGLLPGTYTASLNCWDGNPTSEDPGSFERLNLIPANYFPEVVVEEGSSGVEANFDVPRKKK